MNQEEIKIYKSGMQAGRNDMVIQLISLFRSLSLKYPWAKEAQTYLEQIINR